MSNNAVSDRSVEQGQVFGGTPSNQSAPALSSSSSRGPLPHELSAIQPSSEAAPATRRTRWYDRFRISSRGRSEGSSTVSQYHHGDTYNTTNTHTAPVTTIQHATNVNMGAKDDPLEKLPKHPDISDEWADYTDGSRSRDIKKIKNWLNDPETQELIFWVHAGPEVGKSTLARQVREELRLENQSAVAIFLSKLDSKSEDSVVALIGGEMGRMHRNIAPMVVKAIEECHGLPLSAHIEKILLKPLLALQLHDRLTVIIDAISEWKSHARFIEQLALLAPHTSLIRFIVLGRSKPVEGRYRNIPTRTYALDPVSEDVMAECIDARFDDINWRDGGRPMAEAVLGLATLAAGQFARMEELVSIIRSLPPSDHDDISDPIFGLAISAWNRPHGSGAAESIALNRVALALRPPGHPRRHQSLNYLGAFLWCGHQTSRNAGDLDEAILLHKEAITLCPPGHPDRHHSCNNLAAALHSRYERDGQISDLEEAITLGREALPLRPRGHPYHFDTVDNQRKYLYSSYKRKGNIEDLQEAITLGQEALSSSPKDHAQYAGLISAYEAELAQMTAFSDNV